MPRKLQICNPSAGVTIRAFPQRNLHYNEDFWHLHRLFRLRVDMTMKRRFFLLLSALFLKDKAFAAPQAQRGQANRSASYRTARAVLALPREKSSWTRYIQRDEHENEFLWTGNGEAVDRWNELFAGKRGVEAVHFSVVGKKEDFFLAHGGRRIQAPVKHDRDDDMVVLLTLNRLVKGIAEVRFCVDSYHASDFAFLALPPSEWAALEAEFGAPAVGYRFMTLPDTMAKFWPRLQKTSDEVHARPYNRIA
jgi:hypothetical protein